MPKRATSGNCLVEQRLCARRDGCAPVGVLEGDEIAVLGVDDERAGLPAHENAAEVVPRAVRVPAAIHVRVDDARGDRAEIERGRTQRAELIPAEVLARVAAQRGTPG